MRPLWMALALLIVTSPAAADEASATVNAEDLVYYENSSDGRCHDNERWISSSGPNLIGPPYASLRIDRDCQPL